MPTSSPHIRALDTLRGLAALCVCLFHLSPLFGTGVLMPHAYLAVDFFFALSGFVLVLRYAYVIRPARGNGLTLTQFMGLRMARLYPLYLLSLAIGLGYVLLRLTGNGQLGAAWPDVIRSLLLNLAFLPAAATDRLHDQGPAYPFVVQSWSVAWEIVLSAAFFVWMRRWASGALWIVLVSAFLLVIVTWEYQTLDGGWRMDSFLVGGLRALCLFSLGVYLGMGRLELPRLDAGRDSRLLTVNLSLLLLFAGAYMALIPQSVLAVELILALLVFPLIILIAYHLDSPLFSNRFGDWLGGISYSLYLLHGPVIQIAQSALIRLGVPADTPAIGLALLAGLLGLSTLVWRRFERPIQRRLRQRFGLSDKAAPPTA